MGTNYGDFIAEAVRVLKHKGRIWIAEVRSRFTCADGAEDYGPFKAALQHAGVEVVQEDCSNRMFITFEGCKHTRKSILAGSITWPALKACQYKRR